MLTQGGPQTTLWGTFPWGSPDFIISAHQLLLPSHYFWLIFLFIIFIPIIMLP